MTGHVWSLELLKEMGQLDSERFKKVNRISDLFFFLPIPEVYTLG